MHDARAMGLVQGFGDLHGDVDRARGRQAGRPDLAVERRPVDELHRDEVDAIHGPDVVDRHDVRMVER